MRLSGSVESSAREKPEEEHLQSSEHQQQVVSPPVAHLVIVRAAERRLRAEVGLARRLRLTPHVARLEASRLCIAHESTVSALNTVYSISVRTVCGDWFVQLFMFFFDLH